MFGLHLTDREASIIGGIFIVGLVVCGLVTVGTAGFLGYLVFEGAKAVFGW